MRKTLVKIAQLPAGIPFDPRAAETEAIYRFRAPAEYLKLIDANDPKDPIAKLILPRQEELIAFDSLDPTQERSFTVTTGLQHKFPDTALLLTTVNCAGYCRYCFRKRLFQPENSEVPSDLNPALSYIRQHTEITNVLLSGGDPLSLRTEQLLSLLTSISDSPHVRIIRLGSKTPAFDPDRILNDAILAKGIEKLSQTGKQLYLIAHFDHPREITTKSRAAIRLMSRLGMSCLNQCPLLRGVNSASGVLNRLFEEVASMGCPQYYVFHCRSTDGNTAFSIPLGEAFAIFEQESRSGSGLSKTARYCIAHPKGKLQVLALNGPEILLKFIQACEPNLTGRTFWHPVAAELTSI